VVRRHERTLGVVHELHTVRLELVDGGLDVGDLECASICVVVRPGRLNVETSLVDPTRKRIDAAFSQSSSSPSVSPSNVRGR